MCLLADLCNHTWIPECGLEPTDDHLRLFIDECDMFEFNCDKEKMYEIQNYSECFKPQMCPTVAPCPSHPTCPNHRFHRMGQRFMVVTRNGRRHIPHTHRTTLKMSLPYRMLHGKRRYTPIPKIRREKMKKEAKRKNAKKPKISSKIQSKKVQNILLETIILRKESVLMNGTMFMKIFKAFVTKTMRSNTVKPKTTKSMKTGCSNFKTGCKKDSDFLE